MSHIYIYNDLQEYLDSLAKLCDVDTWIWIAIYDRKKYQQMEEYCYKVYFPSWISNRAYQERKLMERTTFWWTCFVPNNIHVDFIYCIILNWKFYICILLYYENKHLLISNECLIEFSNFMKIWNDIYFLNIACTPKKSFKNWLGLIWTIVDDTSIVLHIKKLFILHFILHLIGILFFLQHQQILNLLHQSKHN